MPLLAPPGAPAARQSAAQSAGLSPEILGLLQILGSAAAPFNPAGAAAEAVTPPVEQTGQNSLAQLLTMILPVLGGLIGKGKGQEIFGKDMIQALQKMLRSRSIEQMPRPQGIPEDIRAPVPAWYEEGVRMRGPGVEQPNPASAPLRGEAHIRPMDPMQGPYGARGIYTNENLDPGFNEAWQVGPDMPYRSTLVPEELSYGRYGVVPTDIGGTTPGYAVYYGTPTITNSQRMVWGDPLSTHRNIGTAFNAADVARLRDQYIVEQLRQNPEERIGKMAYFAPRKSGQSFEPFTSQPSKK